MPLPRECPGASAHLPSQMLLAAVDAFLDAHYEFRCNPKYKGVFGRVKAARDRWAAEEREKRETGERYYTPQFQRPVVRFSSAAAAEQFGKEIREKEAEFYRSATEQSFSRTLIKLIAEKGKDSVDVYKRAQIDRKLFSKIRSRPDYIPSKKTVIALALALELSLDETQFLLERAGFTLSRSILFDVIIEYFISHRRYDIFEVNETLFAYKQSTLG